MVKCPKLGQNCHQSRIGKQFLKMPLLGTAVLFSTAIGGELRQGSVQISDDALEGEGVRLLLKIIM